MGKINRDKSFVEIGNNNATKNSRVLKNYQNLLKEWENQIELRNDLKVQVFELTNSLEKIMVTLCRQEKMIVDELYDEKYPLYVVGKPNQKTLCLVWLDSAINSENHDSVSKNDICFQKATKDMCVKYFQSFLNIIQEKTDLIQDESSDLVT